MHNKNICAIVFSGEHGKDAINQILKAKPKNNKISKTVEARSKSFIKSFKSVPPFEK